MKQLLTLLKKLGKLIKNKKIKKIGHFLFSLLAVIRYGYPARKTTVIGVTGTDGKTTTCKLIYHLLTQANYPAAAITTVGTFTSQKKKDTGLHVTTPNAMELQKEIKRLVNQGIKYIVIESTSIGLDQYRLLGCNFKIGVLTNLTPEHLDYHQTMNKYKKAKAKLFKNIKYAVLNKDDPAFVFFKRQTNPKADILSYSLKQNADFQITQKKLTFTNSKFTMKIKNKKNKYQTSLIGDYNLSNILAASATTTILGLSTKQIKTGLATFKSPTGRMQQVKNNLEITTLIDFAHTPNALQNALKTIKDLKPKKAKIIAVFGCAGGRDKQKRPKMGKIATQLADLSIFTADDPRDEDINEIFTQMEQGAVNSNYIKQPNRQKAINLAVKKAQKGDIVLLFGKGHEKSLAVKGKEIPWSDKKALKKAFDQQS